MLLEGKNAVVYGGGGSIGGAVARGFAREGATVYLAGRTQADLDKVADDVRGAGGTAETAIVDALDEAQVDAHMDAVAAEAGSVDVVLSVISHRSVHGTPLHELATADVMDEVTSSIETMLITSRAAARHMVKQGSGVILAFGGSGPPLRDYYIGGTQIALGAVEFMRRQLAAELGRHGVRVVTLRTGGIPESAADPELRAQLDEMIAGDTLLGRAATLKDVANVAAFVASDRGRTMTGATANISCGSLYDD